MLRGSHQGNALLSKGNQAHRGDIVGGQEMLSE